MKKSALLAWLFLASSCLFCRSFLPSTAQNGRPFLSSSAKTYLFNPLLESGKTCTAFELVNEVNDVASGKPPIVFLPGLDGQGNYSVNCYKALSEQYQCWRLIIGPGDRSTFLTLAKLVMEKIKTFDQPVTVIGESFGGVLAAYITARMPKQVSRMVLVNPATSIADTPWRSIAPLIARTGPLYPAVGISTLLASSLQPQQVIAIGQRVIEEMRATPDRSDAVDRVIEEFKPLTNLPDALPADTLSWRLKEWLDTGNFLVKDLLSTIRTPSLILIGNEDRLLPSIREGPRLQRVMEKAYVDLKMYPGKGHAILDISFDLNKVLKDFNTNVRRREMGDTTIELPSIEDIRAVDKQLDPAFKVFSPIFLSTDNEGKIAEGLQHVPTGGEGRPVLLVGNHQLLGLDMGLIVRQFLREKSVIIRGLAHPIIFNSTNPSTELLQKFGAVKVSPMTFYQLLKNNETIMLFPGGAKEALHSKGQEYQLQWPEKTDFVRMAGLMDAIIVPYAAVGMFESLRIVADMEDFSQLPLLGSISERFRGQLQSARAGVDENILPPVVAPGLPARNYFLFAKPIDTRSFDASNKAVCREVYETIRNDLQHNINALRKFSELDPNKEFWPRIFDEMRSGQKSRIPALTMLEMFLRDRPTV